MTSFALRPVPRRLLRHPRGASRPHRLALDVTLISVAGALGMRVLDVAGNIVGRLDDLVVRRASTEAHPLLAGILVRAGRTIVFVADDQIAELGPGSVRLRSHFTTTPAEPRPWLVALGHDVLDRQIVDIDGTQVTRVSDLVLAPLPDGFRLVGADVSARTLLRRLRPASLRGRVDRERVFDWASVAAFSARGDAATGSVLHLTQAAARLRERGPAAVQALLADLPPAERAKLSDHYTQGGQA